LAQGRRYLAPVLLIAPCTAGAGALGLSG